MQVERHLEISKSGTASSPGSRGKKSKRGPTQVSSLRSAPSFSQARARAASSSTSSPREERVGRGPRRGETNKNAPPLPSPLLHPMEEREKSRSLMQPWPKRTRRFVGLTAKKREENFSAVCPE